MAEMFGNSCTSAGQRVHGLQKCQAAFFVVSGAISVVLLSETLYGPGAPAMGINPTRLLEEFPNL